ncbi:MAG: prepilin-type N-terminal cleavage/methylation domain-containing protein [Armatimonadetes bacterium]|nr:prepilin-type N-terminal cleavage/methylation domain-containing protein [Armatimonadota bacterium]
MNSRGFTLLEVVVAIALLAIGLFGVMRALSQGMAVQRDAEARTTGIELAEQKLAELQLDPELSAGQDEGDFGDLYPSYRWTSDIAETDQEGLYRLRVVVSWPSGVNEHSVDVETCFAPNVLVGPESGEASPSSSSSSP